MKKSFSVSEFKAKSLALFEKIARNGESIIVTKRGKPIAEVIPFAQPRSELKAGRLAATLLHEEDIVTPFGAKLWTAAEDPEGE
jgi:prevent-host-death family protein